MGIRKGLFLQWHSPVMGHSPAWERGGGAQGAPSHPTKPHTATGTSNKHIQPFYKHRESWVGSKNTPGRSTWPCPGYREVWGENE